jgi:hypothetical protein
LGKEHAADGCAQLQYSYNPLDTARSSTWGFYGLGFDGRIRLRPNQVFTEHISLYGRTRIYGDLTLQGGSITNLRNSSTRYNTSSYTVVPNSTWTNIQDVIIIRFAGSNTLSWINQNTGFRNDTGIIILVTITFACQRNSGLSTGITAIGIVLNNSDAQTLGTQDVSGYDAVSISGSCYLDPGETVNCRIFQNSGGGFTDYKNIVVSINTSPLV